VRVMGLWKSRKGSERLGVEGSVHIGKVDRDVQVAHCIKNADGSIETVLMMDWNRVL
jgi:hypothetical protein